MGYSAGSWPPVDRQALYAAETGWKAACCRGTGRAGTYITRVPLARCASKFTCGGLRPFDANVAGGALSNAAFSWHCQEHVPPCTSWRLPTGYELRHKRACTAISGTTHTAQFATGRFLPGRDAPLAVGTSIGWSSANLAVRKACAQARHTNIAGLVFCSRAHTTRHAHRGWCWWHWRRRSDGVPFWWHHCGIVQYASI